MCHETKCIRQKKFEEIVAAKECQLRRVYSLSCGTSSSGLKMMCVMRQAVSSSKKLWKRSPCNKGHSSRLRCAPELLKKKAQS